MLSNHHNFMLIIQIYVTTHFSCQVENKNYFISNKPKKCYPENLHRIIRYQLAKCYWYLNEFLQSNTAAGIQIHSNLSRKTRFKAYVRIIKHNLQEHFMLCNTFYMLCTIA